MFAALKVCSFARTLCCGDLILPISLHELGCYIINGIHCEKLGFVENLQIANFEHSQSFPGVHYNVSENSVSHLPLVRILPTGPSTDNTNKVKQ